MSPQIATIVFAFGVLGLFMLDRDSRARTSKVLWIPVMWLLINGSRPVSVWLQLEPLNKIQNPDQYLEGSPLDALVSIVLLVSGSVFLLGRRAKVGKMRRRNRLVLLFYFYCGMSVMWCCYPEFASIL